MDIFENKADYLNPAPNVNYLKISDDFIKQNQSLLTPLDSIGDILATTPSLSIELGKVEDCLKFTEPLKTSLGDMGTLYAKQIDPFSLNLLETNSGLVNIFESVGVDLISKREPYILDLGQSSLFSSIPEALTISVLSQDVFARTDLCCKPLGLTDKPLFDFRESVFDLSNSNKSIYESLTRDLPSLYLLNPLEMTIPATELYTTVKLPEIIEGDLRFLIEEKPIHSRIIDRSIKLEGLLKGIDRDLLIPYQGMLEVLSVSSADQTRHFSTSARELFEHTLRKLAPDRDVINWDEESKFRDGRGNPTREGRIQYIYRNIDKSSEFSNFVDKDIKSKLAFLKVMQTGVHELDSKYDRTQMDAIKVIMECTLVSLIELANLE